MPSDSISGGSSSPTLPDLATLLPERLLLAGWVVEPRAGHFRCGTEKHHVEPKVMGVLVVLAARQGDVVSRDEIFDLVWPDVVVTESALNRCVSDLRRVLGDDARRPTIIETVPKVGYRLMATVKPAPSAPPPVVGGDVELERSAYSGGDSFDAATDAADSVPVLASSAVSLAAPNQAASERRPYLHLAGIALVLAAIVAGMWGAEGSAPTPPPVDVRAVTTLPGPEYGGVLSPDGRRVAFTWRGARGADQPDLYIQNVTGSAPLQLTGDERREWFPAWSPDGRRLAFLRESGDGTSGYGASIHTISELGTDERMLLHDGVLNGGLSWSPTGNRLAYVGPGEPDERTSIFLLDLHTGERQRLTRPEQSYEDDLFPAFSPDGLEIAFVRRRTNSSGDLYRVSIDGNEPERLTEDHAHLMPPAWTPDGRSVVFSSNRSGVFRLWRVAPGEAPALVSVPSKDPGRPSISEAGTMIVADWAIDTNLWVLESGADAPHSLFVSTQWEQYPALSPDGRRVAYVSTRTGDAELWVGSVDGADAVQLTHFGGVSIGRPQWSPDGAVLVFHVQQDAGADLYALPSEGGTPRQLSRHPAHDMNPRWSRDGRAVYFGSDRSGDWEMWRISAEGGAAERLTVGGGFVGEEDATGTRLYFARRYEPGLMVLDLDRVGDSGAEPECVLPSLSPANWGNWGVTDRGVVAAVSSEDGLQIVLWDEDRGEHRVLHTTDGPLGPGGALSSSWSADVLVWSQIDGFENDIFLVEPLPF